MEIRKAVMMIKVMIITIALSSGVCLADKSAVTIEAPDQVAKGTEITVKVHVTHSSNSFFHHTNWVKVFVNGQQEGFWEYSGRNLPEDAKFTKEIKLTITEPTEIVAEANCNMHGSQGPAEKRIGIKE